MHGSIKKRSTWQFVADLGLQPMQRCPGCRLDQGAITAKVLPGEEFSSCGLGVNLLEEGFRHLSRKQALSVWGEGSGVPDRIIKIQAYKPAKEQMVLEMLAEPALERGGVEHLNKKGPQKVLRRDEGVALFGVDLVKERGSPKKGGPGRSSGGWPAGGDSPGCAPQGAKEHKRRLAHLFSPHAHPLI